MTILFKKDWDNYPSAIVDTQTKNKSFIRLAGIYKKMGIKNYEFILQLHNPELQNLDPFDPDLTQEQIMSIAIECKSNFFYFCREIVRVPGGSIDNPISLKANRGNIALYWSFFNHITVILIQPRQTGKSLSTDILMRYLLNIRCTNTQINLLTKDDKLRSANLDRIKNLESELPPYLRLRRRDDLANTEELTIKALNNTYLSHLPNKSPKLALNVGRGLVSPIFHLDEAAFFYNVAISLPAALAAGTAARNTAASKNEPYGNILTTTSGKKDDKDGKYIFTLLSNSAIWDEKFLDAEDIEELNHIVRRNSPKGEYRVNCTFNHRQLGYSDQWLKQSLENALATGEDAARDFFNIWTSGTQSSPFTVQISEMILNSEQSDYYTDIADKYAYIIRWYIPEDKVQGYMVNNLTTMGLDTSDAIGNDDIGLHIRDIKTGETIACGNYNETNIITFSEWLADILQLYPNITLVIERRSSAIAIIDNLILILLSRNIDPFKRIYNKVVQERDEFPDRFKDIDKPLYARSNEVYIKYKKLFGFATSGSGLTSRSELYGSTLQNMVKLTGSVVKDKKLIEQLLGLIVKNGRVDHPDGEHDDLVIGSLLSMWLLLHGKNLYFYGIDNRHILVNNQTKAIDNTPVNVYNRRQNDYYKDRIEKLVETISNEPDDFVAYRLESELRMLSNRISDEDKQTLSVDDLITQLRDYRKQSKKLFNNFY